jgi:O-antigen/teichoic acid export membrane protein
MRGVPRHRQGSETMTAVQARSVTPRPLTVDVLLTLGSKLGVVILNTATGIVIARALGPSGRGVVAVAFAFTYLLIQFGVLGLHSANAYFASREPEQISQILVNALWTVFVAGVALAVIGLGVREMFPSALRGLDLPEVAVVIVGVPAVLTILLLQGLLLAQGRMLAYNAVDLWTAGATTAGMIVVLFGFAGGVLAAIAVFVGVNVVGALAIVMLLRGHLRTSFRFDRRLFRTMLRYGFRLYLAALLTYLVWRLNLLLINSYRGSAAAGNFSIAAAFGETIALLPTVVALNLFPRIARGDEFSDTGRVFRSLTLIYGCFCIAIIPLIDPLIRLLYGSAFANAVGFSYWLLPGVFSYGMVSVLSYHFAGRGFPLRALVVWLVGLVLDLVIAFPALASGRSAYFASIAVSVAYAAVLVLHIELYAAESGGRSSLVPRPRETASLIREVGRSLVSARRVHD